MFIVLTTVCLYGVIFGVIQASNDPENHKCSFAILFSIVIEIKETEPIGIAIGLVFRSPIISSKASTSKLASVSASPH